MEAEKITLAEAMSDLKDNLENEYRRINTLLLTVFHLMQISDKIFAEIEDILEANQKYRFDIKRKHKDIARKIHDEYMPLFNRLHGSDLGNMYKDNLELEELIRVWMGFDKSKRAIIQDIPTDGEAITAQRNCIGDIELRNTEGWVIRLPKNFQECLNIESSVLQGIDEGEKVPCGLRIYVGKEVEEDEN